MGGFGTPDRAFRRIDRPRRSRLGSTLPDIPGGALELATNTLRSGYVVMSVASIPNACVRRMFGTACLK